MVYWCYQDKPVERQSKMAASAFFRSMLADTLFGILHNSATGHF
jgi:hypothetical protein